MPSLPARAALAAGIAAVAGLGVAAWLVLGPFGQEDRFADCRATAVSAGAAAIGGPFELTDQTGARVSSSEVIDGPTLIYFGYTWCPDICPFDTARMAEATDILAERGLDVTPVFITIDPARDTPEVLAGYAANLHPRMIALTGTEAEIADVARQWRVYRAKSGDEPVDYLMDHSTFTYFVDAEHGFLDIFRREASAQDVADRVQCFAERM